MKKLILAAMVLAIAGMNVQIAKAGDREWATVGKVLTGVAVGAAVVSALDCQPGYASVSYGYTVPACPPPAPVIYAPAPVVYVPRPAVVYSPPVYVMPYRPVVSVNVAYGYGHHYRQSHRNHRW